MLVAELKVVVLGIYGGVGRNGWISRLLLWEVQGFYTKKRPNNVVFGLNWYPVQGKSLKLVRKYTILRAVQGKLPEERCCFITLLSCRIKLCKLTGGMS